MLILGIQDFLSEVLGEINITNQIVEEVYHGNTNIQNLIQHDDHQALLTELHHDVLATYEILDTALEDTLKTLRRRWTLSERCYIVPSSSCLWRSSLLIC